MLVYDTGGNTHKNSWDKTCTLLLLQIWMVHY